MMFPEYLDLTSFLAPSKEDYGLKKRTKDRVDGEKGGKGRRGLRIGCGMLCGAHWEHGASLSSFLGINMG